MYAHKPRNNSRVLVADNAFRTLQSDANFAGAVFDLSMPYLQGPDLIRYMRTEKRLMKIPVLIITAEADIKRVASSFSAGATLMLSKPFTAQPPSTITAFDVGFGGSSEDLIACLTRKIPVGAGSTEPTPVMVDRDERESIEGPVDLSMLAAWRRTMPAAR